MKFTVPICVACCIAVTSVAADESLCCELFTSRDLQGEKLEFCIEDGKTQSAYDISFSNGTNKIRSAKCGAHVEAQVCPGGYHEAPVHGQKDKKITCKTVMKNPYEARKVLSIHGEQYYRQMTALEVSTIIINNHPWVAKGPDYVSMSRQEKAGILWNQILKSANQVASAAGPTDFYDIDANSLYDQWGDEHDCQNNVFNSQGNVGKARWEDLSGHPYTGIFDGGADTGFIRLSTVQPVNEDVNSALPKMNPTIELKFLRNQRDSANTIGKFNFVGQTDYNFFGSSLSTVQDWGQMNFENMQVFEKLKSATAYQGSVGHSDFAMYNQDGIHVDEPKFPFRLWFEPMTNINFPSNKYDSPIFDQMQTIQPNQVLYKVLANEEWGSADQHIANIVLETELVTSEWADQKMYFRRQRMDDDIRYHPHWSDNLFYYLDEFDLAGPTLHPYTEKIRSSCPADFMFQ